MKIIKIWRKLSNCGVQENTDLLAKKRIILSNRIAFVIGVFFIPMVVFDVFVVLPLSYLYFIELGFVLVFFIVPLLNKIRQYTLAKHLLIYNFLLPSTIIASIFSDVSIQDIHAREISAITLLALPFLLFENREKISIIISSSLIIVGYFSVEVLTPLLSLGLPINQDVKHFAIHYGFPLTSMFTLILVINASRNLDTNLVLNLLKEAQAKNKKLEKQGKELQDLNETLEERVEQRTEELKDAYEEIKDSVLYAQNIQKAILGETQIITQEFEDAFIFFNPRDIVSGDFYWFSKVETNQHTLKLLVIADCTGHGVPGAFMTLLGTGILDEIVNNQQVYEPSKILKLLDERIIQALESQTRGNTQDGMDLSLVLINEENKSLHFAGAKNPLFYVRNNELIEVKSSKYPIGGTDYKETKTFPCHNIYLEKNDVFYMFSDGFQDQFGGNDDRKYMRTRFRDFLKDMSSLPMEKQKSLLSQEFQDWKNNTAQTDDVLVMGFKVF